MTTTPRHGARSRGARWAAVLGTIMIGLATTGTATAGQKEPDPTADVTFGCRDGEGYIAVSIDADVKNDWTFHIEINEFQVGTSVSVGDYEYDQYPTGSYFVEVFWTNEETTIFSETLTFVCGAVSTEPAPDTTDVDSGGGGIPETGQASTTLLVLAGLLITSGVALVMVRRRPEHI